MHYSWQVVAQVLSFLSMTQVLSLVLSLITMKQSSSMARRSLLMTRDFHGLLTGFKKQNDITSFPEMYYTNNLDFKRCKEEFYKNDDVLWKSFMDDIQPEENPAQ
jgi:hypothetical protein